MHGLPVPNQFNAVLSVMLQHQGDCFKNHIGTFAACEQGISAQVGCVVPYKSLPQAYHLKCCNDIHLIY